MWQCPRCRETVDDHFDACWNCGTGPDGTPTPGFVREPDVAADEADRSAPEGAVRSFPAGGQAPGESPSDWLVAVASFNFPAEAELHRLALEREGIPALVAEDSAFGTLSASSAGVKVLVAGPDAPRARRVLDRAASSGAPGQGASGQSAGEVVFRCQACAGWIAFPATRRGHVEVCPRCNAHVDVPG